MDIDERLEKLAQRQEALTQTVKSLASMHRDNQREWEARWTASEKRWASITAAIQQDAERIRALARIAELHDRRRSHPEDQAP